MTLSDYIAIATLLVSAAGWYFTYRSQRKLQKQQQDYERERDARQTLVPIWSKQLDAIETWLSEAVPLSYAILYRSKSADVDVRLVRWTNELNALFEVARHRDPAFATANRWTDDSQGFPTDLPQLLVITSKLQGRTLELVFQGNLQMASEQARRLGDVTGNAFDALERVRRHSAGGAG